jgi:DNA-binding NtrC family response regulator
LSELPENGSNGLIGSSVPIVELKQIIKQVAPTDVTVLVTGESGAGKEVVANLIHLSSKRKDKPFVTVNCGAIPEGIIESELFGHEKGSFTGAIETRKGYFEAANGGTIFLDEIGELPLATQVKFLRILENGEYVKVGGTKNERVDARVIAATNKNLEHQISINAFREDLYYRLRSINIFIPPLRERKEDIKPLFDHFVKQFCRKNNITFKGISSEAFEYITGYNWPGNIRQLKNFTESLITLNHGKIIEREDVLKQLNVPKAETTTLPAVMYGFKERDERQLLFRALFEIKNDIMDLKQHIENIELNGNIGSNPENFVIPKEKLSDMTFEDYEQELLTFYWNKYHGNVNRIARMLKLSGRTLYRKFKDYGLKNEKY